MNIILDQENNLLSEKSVDKKNTDLYDIGFMVKKYRAKRGITRQVLANKSGISLRYLAQLESEKANPSVLVIRNIANALNLTLPELFLINSNEVNKDSISSKLNSFTSSQRNKVFSLVETISKENNLKKNRNKIALIGLRGAGKSTIGNMYNKEFKLPLFEATTEIEKLGGMNINEIIELGGQGMYRRFEYDIISTIHKNNNKLILLTGGSIVSEKETYNYLLNNYFTIWIKASPNDHMNRVLKQGDSRPMRSNPRAMEDLNNILKERNGLYSKADLTIDTENLTAEQAYRELKLKLFNT